MNVQGVDSVCNRPIETTPLKGSNSPKENKFLAGVSKIYNTVADFFKEIGAFFKYHLNFKAALKDFKFKMDQGIVVDSAYIKFLKNHKEKFNIKHERLFEIHNNLNSPNSALNSGILMQKFHGQYRPSFDLLQSEKKFNVSDGYNKACEYFNNK